MIGVASEEDIFVHPAQDIIDLTGDEKTENARLANAFVLTPVKKHVSSLFLRFHLLLTGTGLCYSQALVYICVNLGSRATAANTWNWSRWRFQV